MSDSTLVNYINEVGAVAAAGSGILTAFGVKPRLYFNSAAQDQLYTKSATGVAIAGTIVAAALSYSSIKINNNPTSWVYIIALSFCVLLLSLVVFLWISTYATYLTSSNGKERSIIGGLWKNKGYILTTQSIQKDIYSDSSKVDQVFNRSSRSTAYASLALSSVIIPIALSISVFFSVAWMSGAGSIQQHDIKLLAETIKKPESIINKPLNMISYRAISYELKNATDQLFKILRSSPDSIRSYSHEDRTLIIKAGAIVTLSEESKNPQKTKTRELIDIAISIFKTSDSFRADYFDALILKSKVLEQELISAQGDDTTRSRLLEEAIQILHDSATLENDPEKKSIISLREAKILYARARPNNSNPIDWNSSSLTAANTIISAFPDQFLQSHPEALSSFMEIRLRYLISEKAKNPEKSFLSLRDETLQISRKFIQPLLNQPCTGETFAPLTNYAKIAHDQAYSYLDPSADSETQLKGINFLNEAVKALELAIAFLNQGDIGNDFSSMTGDFLLDLARSHALKIGYLSTKKEETRDIRIKVYELLNAIDSSNVTSVEKRKRLLSDLVKRPEWESVCHDSKILFLTRYAQAYTEPINECIIR